MLDPWQELVLDRALQVRRDGKWAASRVGLVVPRQNGKGSVLEARELAGLFLLGEELILHSAHEFKTAAEAFLRIRNLIENTPDLERRVLRIRTASGSEAIELVSGQRLRFVARSGGSGRGFTGDVVILDEAYELSPAITSALVPTMSARRNPQLWFTSSAPTPADGSAILRKLCREGRKGGVSLAYLEWCAADGCDLDDREAWAAANPGLGERITEEFITDTERAVLDEDSFARERCGIWYEDEVESVIPRLTWHRLVDPASQMLDPVCLAVDVNTDRTASSVAVAGRREDGRIHVEVIDHKPGTDWLVGRVAELFARHRVSMVAIDPKWTPEEVRSDLEGRDELDVHPVKTGETVQGCADFYDDAVNDRLRHLGQVVLDSALFGARKRPVGDGWAWHRKNSTVDISPLVAVTLARWSAAQPAPEAEPWFAYT